MSHRSLAQAEKLLTGRRQFILSGASLMVLPWLGSMAQGAVKRHASFVSDPFALGVASGEPAPRRHGAVDAARTPADQQAAACRPRRTKWLGKSPPTTP